MKQWRLYSGCELLGTIEEASEDFAWFYGRFEPTPAFAAVRPAFEHWRAAKEQRKRDSSRASHVGCLEAWRTLLNLGLHLEPVDGERNVVKVIVVIDGRDVQWTPDRHG